MSALLVKDAPDGLHKWLKAEASFNRRSLNQQVLTCLEWCMRTYGEAQPRNPFDNPAILAHPTVRKEQDRFAHGRELAAHIMALDGIDAETAKTMRTSIRTLRQSKTREFDYACFA